mgnify:CR=1 FL=1
MFYRKIYIYKYLYLYMSKIITITDNLYEKLKKMKGDESFSMAIAKVLNRLEKGNREMVLKSIQRHKKAVQEAFKGIDSLEYIKEIRKNWKWDRYAK